LTTDETARRYGVKKGAILLTDEDCPFYDGSRCTIYPVRPPQCERWPHIGFLEHPKIDDDKRAERLAGSMTVCPGIKGME